MNEPGTLTEQLLHTPLTISYADAINHPFLRSAGEGAIDKSLLSLWLSQDRIYAAYAYPKFIGALIAAIPFNKSFVLESDAHNRRILKTLTACLENIINEVDFFVKTAETHELDLEMWKERKGTRDYVAEMDSIAGSKNVAEGLVFLWAMEKVYLDAWTFVRTELQKRQSQPQAPTDLLVTQFVENWTSPEFVKFRAAEIWERVVELEIDFWPSVGEEFRMRKDKI
ncbi:heme oxygenase-like protein [Mycena leptocephala]|nr:heme oxygenase-like protein [Mycena leptocephala]